MSVHPTWLALGGQKRILNPLDIESQMVVSSHVDAGALTWVLWKSSPCS